ncbi:MAG TPA: four helix bundle protein [Thermoanaerobaculia bacterium]|nr:four helix bundle protein [Thermoanaerobaculia bacterium]
MNKSNYRDLVVWQRSRQLTAAIYRITRQFPSEERFCLTQQLRRAALSILCNIAEAHGRRSIKSRLHFLDIAYGSALEVEAQIVIAGDLEYLASAATDALVEQLLEVTRLLNGLIRYYDRKLASA